MKLENIVKMFVPAVFAANTAYAIEAAKVATPEEIVAVRKINNNVPRDVPVSKNNEEDWSKQEDLMTSGKVRVLIEPVADQSGYCIIGLDGFPQVYDLSRVDKRAKNGKLAEEELILNLAEKDPAKRFYFPCDRKAEVPKPTIPVSPTPITPEPTKELPSLTFSAGAGYVQIWGNEDATYGHSGILRGGKLHLTVQRSDVKGWYWGGTAMGYYGEGSNSVDINVPATEGPLAGQLAMIGKNDYTLEQFGIGVGSMFGYMFNFENKGRFGLGLELEHGFMYDRVTREFMESSAHYINGNLVEGTTISNNSDDADTQFYTYLMPGLRAKFPFVCLNLAGGFRTNFSDVDGMINAGIAYCPNKE